MKVLQINAVNGYSSTGRTVHELNKSLISRGISGYVAYSESIVESEDHYKIGNIVDHKIHALFSRLTGKQAYFSTRQTKKLLKYIDKISPDIIHLRNLHSNYININLLLKYISDNKLPTVITLHDCWFFTGGCTYYTEAGCSRWMDNCGNCPILKSKKISWFIDNTSNVLNDKKQWFEKIEKLAVVGVSDWITNEAKKSILKNSWCLKRIYNWIDMDVFKPHINHELIDKFDLANKFIILGVAQIWTNQKGLHTFIELSKRLNEESTIILVGSIDPTLTLPHNIISIGPTNDIKELSDYYAIADVLVNPSIQETFGKVTAESLASGTPVIVFDETASPELVGKNGKCGYVVKKNDIDEIEQKISKIHIDGKKTYQKNCRERALELFNKESCIDQYVELYQTMLN